jgi:hypothetical protein
LKRTAPFQHFLQLEGALLEQCRLFDDAVSYCTPAL